MSRRRLIAAGWLLVLGLSSLLPLSAIFQGVIHLGGGTMVINGPLRKPLIAIGTNVVLPAGSRAVVLTLGGDIRLRGRASDDLVAVDGRAYLGRNARVDGDVVSLLGGIYQGPGVVARGRLGGALHQWNGRSVRHERDVGRLLGNSMRLGLAAGLALLLAGTCVTIVFPWQVVLISTTLRGAPLRSAAAGLMATLTFMFLVVPLGLSLAGLPFALLLTGAASLAWLFGMTAAAVVLGRMLAQRRVSLLWAAAAGLVALAVVMAVPIVGPLAVTGTGLAGAGALAVALVGRAHPAAPLP
jgi:hypothetical protein